MMGVPLIDLSRAPFGLDDDVKEAVARVLAHKRYILGPEVEEFEKEASLHLEGAEIIGVSSGTDALLVSLMALGVGHGDRVVTTPFSFFATAGVVRRLGAIPVLVDIEPETYCLDTTRLPDPGPAQVKAIIPVHLFGHTMDLDPVRAWSGGEVAIVEDAAQAIGARDSNGRLAGTMGDCSAFSFFPTKNLGAIGDAGMVATADKSLAERVRRFRAHGQSSPYHHDDVGGNFRLDALQAAALRASLMYLEELNQTRVRNARGYEERFAAADLGGDRLVTPRITDGHTFHQYVVRVLHGRRDALLEGLRERGIGAAVYYPVPFHLQPCFRDLGLAEGSFPEAESASLEVLALPIFPGLTEVEQDQVVEAIRDLL